MSATVPTLRHRHVEVDALDLHVVEAGASNGSDFLLLHGWPEDWSLYERLLELLGTDARAVAIDLPGIGGSMASPKSGEKRWLAQRISNAIHALGLQNVTLAGHDIGGQIVYGCMRICPHAVARAALMDIAIPGVAPWDEVVRNPYLWHFAFHAVPDLPEKLVAGHVADYFAFFFNELAGPRGVPAADRARYAAAYARPAALQTGFGWYRAFAQDEKDNKRDHGQPVRMPVLCLRGDQEHGAIADYVEGLHRAGCAQVDSVLITECGHFAPSEQPVQVAAALRRFARVNPVSAAAATETAP